MDQPYWTEFARAELPRDMRTELYDYLRQRREWFVLHRPQNAELARTVPGLMETLEVRWREEWLRARLAEVSCADRNR
jgi:hypothetical protein